jgi:tetratricopeptide (TPR) repeat protein
MTLHRVLFAVALALAATSPAGAQFKTWKDLREPPDNKLPMCGLAPSKLVPDLCCVKYRVTTNSPECQAYFDQGLGYFYSYVWMEAARSFETACKYDPECALAWWGLNRALERYGRSSQNDALKKAQALMGKASHREQLLIQARLEEKGLWPNVGDAEARKKAAIKTVDTLLALYDDDEEGWYYRAQLASGGGMFGGPGQLAHVPYYKALLRINPLHPGGNHELVHFYENFKRPALGMPYADKYIESSPGIPHAFHMQAHLATRVGRWDKTVDRSSKAIELERAYHKFMKVRPGEDQQYAHHVETLMRGLIHDGRFADADKLKQECLADNIKQPQVWFRLHLEQRDYDAALKIARDERDKIGRSYLMALVYLKKHETERAAPEVGVLQEAYQTKRYDKQLELKLWEVLGILQCQQGQPEAGLKLLAKAVERTKSDYTHHAWGNGAYHMEAWGIAALGCGKYDVAEEAFLEALAHDSGCFHAALGLHVLCTKLNRISEAERFMELAQRSWRKAASSDVVRELEEMRCATTAIVEGDLRR